MPYLVPSMPYEDLHALRSTPRASVLPRYVYRRTAAGAVATDGLARRCYVGQIEKPASSILSLCHPSPNVDVVSSIVLEQQLVQRAVAAAISVLRRCSNGTFIHHVFFAAGWVSFAVRTGSPTSGKGT